MTLFFVGMGLLSVGFGLAGRAGQVTHLISGTAFLCAAVLTLTAIA